MYVAIFHEKYSTPTAIKNKVYLTPELSNKLSLGKMFKNIVYQVILQEVVFDIGNIFNLLH